jgi:cysteine desulfurase
VILANNEIGTINEIQAIGRVVAAYKKEHAQTLPLFHTDACQALQYLALEADALHVDLLTVNAAKVYGPKGTGALFVRRGVKLRPMQFGGSQEFGRRPGTENVAGIVGFAAAVLEAQELRGLESARVEALRDQLIEGIQKTIPKIRLNGHKKDRLPNNVNISFMDLEGEALTLYLDAKGIYVSTGSACTSASLDPSHVILALGLPYGVAHGSIRFTLGRATTKEDIDYVLEVLPPLVEKLRAMSPVHVDPKYYE